MSSISIGSSLALKARRLGATGLFRPEMACRGCVEDDIHERLPPCHRLEAVSHELSSTLSHSDQLVNMKAACELGRGMFRLRPIVADSATSSAPAVDLPEWPPRAGFFMMRQPLRSTAFLQLSANRQAAA